MMKEKNTGAEKFAPSLDDGFHGRARRQAFSACASILIRWPPAMPEKRRQVRTWRFVAMRVLSEAGQGFRLVAILPDVIHWEAGEIWASNRQMAEEAGGCADKTIQRDVTDFVRRGLLRSEPGWRKNSAGQFCRTRILRLSIPTDYRGPAPDLDRGDNRDTTCPYPPGDNRDTTCPPGPDTRCPINDSDKRRELEEGRCN